MVKRDPFPGFPAPPCSRRVPDFRRNEHADGGSQDEPATETGGHVNEKAVIKKLGAGIDLLARALPNLALTEVESEAIKAILDRQAGLRDGLRARMLERIRADSKKLRRFEHMRRQREREAMEKVHRRTGFTDRVIILPGSFEGGRA